MTLFTKPISGAVTKRALWIIGGIIAALVIFEFGLLMGGRHAHWEYFSGHGSGPGAWSNTPSGMPHVRVALSGHGASGVVSSLSLPKITITGRDGTSQTIILASTTQVLTERSGPGGDRAASSSDIRPGDFIVVIGKPGSGSAIDAGFVRILGAPAATGSAATLH